MLMHVLRTTTAARRLTCLRKPWTMEYRRRGRARQADRRISGLYRKVVSGCSTAATWGACGRNTSCRSSAYLAKGGEGAATMSVVDART